MILLALTVDFWVAITACILSSFVWLFFAWKASRSGSIIEERDNFNRIISTRESDENIPIYKSGYFKMFFVHLLFGGIIFWLIAADFWDVWFPSK